MLKRNMPRRLPTILGTICGSLLLAVLVAVPVMAAEPVELTLDRVAMSMRNAQGSRQFFGDLTVEDGEVIEDDVHVVSGNVEMEGDARITGDLTVVSGDIEIGEDATVDGDVTSATGNVDVDGHIGGDLLVGSGDVELSSSASVGGDVGVVSGNIDREEGAQVGGDVMQGPAVRSPRMFAPLAPHAPDLSEAPGISFAPQQQGFFGKILGLFGRLLLAALMTAFAMLLVGGLFYLKPQVIADTRRQLRENVALSAIIGVLVNLMAFFFAGLFAATLCLLPLTLILLLLLLAVNVVGWSVASQILGERIVGMTNQKVQPILTILVGAIIISGVCALLWAFGGCFRVLGFILLIGVSSLGTGAVLVPWINRTRGSQGGGSDGGGVPSSRGPVGSPPSPSGTTTPSGSEPVETDIAAPIDYVTAEEVNLENSAVPAQSSVTRGGVEVSVKSATPEVGGNEPVELDVAGPIDYVTAQEVITEDALSTGDDFSQIKGIGPSYARRLKDGGFKSYTQLAAATPEEVAAAIGWPVDRVKRSEIIDQAKVLAQKP